MHFYDAVKKQLEYVSELINRIYGVRGKIKWREDKGYWVLRTYRKHIVRDVYTFFLPWQQNMDSATPIFR